MGASSCGAAGTLGAAGTDGTVGAGFLSTNTTSRTAIRITTLITTMSPVGMRRAGAADFAAAAGGGGAGAASGTTGAGA